MNTATVLKSAVPDKASPRRRPAKATLSLKQIYAGIYRQRYLALAIVVGALIVGALVTYATPRSYTAAASVQLEQQVPRVIPNADLVPETAVQDSARFLQTQLDRILSRSMAEAVEERLGISGSPRHLSALGFEDGGANVRREQVVSALQGSVTAELGLNTRLARITFTSRDPAVSAAIANGYADALASGNLVAKSETTARAEQYLIEQLAEAKAKLQDSERAMLGFARAADLTTPVVDGARGDRGGSLRAQQLGQLNDSLAEATARRIDAEQRWQQVRNTPAMQLPEVQDNRAVQDLISQRAQLDAQLADDRQRYTDDYPGVTSTEAKGQELEQQIQALAANIKQSFQGRYTAALQTERQLRGAVNQLRGAAMSERERGVDYNALQREVDTNRAFYDGLLQRYSEVAAASGVPGENITVVDRAHPPTQASSPNVVQNLALSGLLGLILAMGMGLLRERSVTVVRSAEDAERSLGIPTLGVIPSVGGKKRADDALLDPRSPQSEAYFSVAVALYQMVGNALPKTLLVTSSTPGEGKSTSSVGVARSFAAMRKRVLLIDADLRRPSLGIMLSAPVGPGFANVLAGTAPVEEAIQHIDAFGFDLIAAGDDSENPVTLLSADNLAQVLDGLSTRYDVVVVDGPPIMGIADSIMLAEQVEAGLLVVEANGIDAERLDVAVSRLPADLPIGSVITKFNARTAGVKYGDSNYYRY